MVPLTTLRELFVYHYWARDRQLAACAALASEQLERPLGGSFTSVRHTLVHLLGAEWVWLERCRGNSPARMPGADEMPTLASIGERMRAVEQGMRAYLSGLEDSALTQTVRYTNFSGQNWEYPLWMVLLHLLNHQTYHRGQIATLLRQLGVEPPSVDLLVARDLGAL